MKEEKDEKNEKNEKNEKDETFSLIFLHGVGGTGEGWVDLLQRISPEKTKLIYPTAPVGAVTIYGDQYMPSWFNMIDSKTINVFELKESAIFVHSIVEKEIKKGRRPENIIIGGFSQGAALSLYSVLTCRRRLGGLFVLSGWHPAPWEFAESCAPSPSHALPNCHTPTLICHGNNDTKVPLEWGRNCEKSLLSFMTQLEFKEIDGLGHEVDDSIEHEISLFLAKIAKQNLA
ncbi:acyl-protein thioesterase 1 [Eurytemora carolleeae]|uniref:acyl-protein thioesterase 1 n=1 Tax=Eurytemora carolleeae TaxID=1294199 RepID=UPI000C76F42D|nr:acyl-protein thioesterase 1 [Eurytemora carolleeae]|eukprot:XP_023326317.1 acyl-protein thioesterase 1-like [Eurytemora affinis]